MSRHQSNSSSSVRYLALSSVAPLLVFAASCGKDDKPAGVSFDAPLVKPPVDESTPPGLKKKSTKLTLQGVETYALSKQERIVKLLTQESGAINGGKCNGIVGCSLQALDTRIGEINKRSKETAKKCQDNPVVAHSFEIRGQKITQQLQCSDVFNVDAMNKGGHSGLVFGKKDTYFSMGMTLDQTEGRYSYWANYDRKKGEVEFLEGYTYEPSGTTPRSHILRLRANRVKKSFEMVYQGQGQIGLDCGFHMVSNAKELVLKGRFPTRPFADGETCEVFAEEEVCLDATSLEVKTDCTLTSASFTFSAISRDSAVGTEARAELKAKMTAKSYAQIAGVTPFAEDKK